MAAEFFCVSCKTPFVNRHPLDESGRCMMCRQGLSGYDAVYSYGSYEGTLRKLLHVFKFEKVHTLAKPLGALLARALPREQRFDAIVPMPLHWRRRWQRGFNQSDLLAREISRRWNVPVVPAIRRVKSSPPQAGLSNAKRRANVAGAFSNVGSWVASVRFLTRRLGHWMPHRARKRLRNIAKAYRLDGQRVLLIDDVLTTGATAAACARALKRAGASHVTLLTVARTDRRFAVHDFLEATSATGGAARGAAIAAGAGGTKFAC
jgi:predicted amidophosphoribosyltransferase